MKLAIVSTLSFFLMCCSAAKPKSTSTIRFDHMAIMTDDVKGTVKWYMDVFETHPIENKTGNPSIQWVAIGDSELHIVPSLGAPIPIHKSVHMAIGVRNLEELINRLKAKNWYFEGWTEGENQITTRKDGIRQIYVQDPNGYWIEINDAFDQKK